jgi:hypothetical protein
MGREALMKKWWWVALTAAYLVGGQVILAQQEGDDIQLLKTALEKVPRYCKPATAAYDIGLDNTETKAGLDQTQDEVTELLKLEFLFQERRYQLKSEKKTDSAGRSVTLIHFWPQPEKERLKPPQGASIQVRALNWGINQMLGEITLDQATGEIMSIDGQVPERVKGKFHGIPIGDIKLLKLYHRQKESKEGWIPGTTDTTLHYSATFHGTKHQHFVTTYDCTARK